MSSDSVDRVEHLFKEIRESGRSEAGLRDFVERPAMDVFDAEVGGDGSGGA